MKNILILIISCIQLNLYSQICTTTVAYDYIETWNWPSAWAVGPNTGYYTNAFVSSNASAALIGNGTGSSGIEAGNYVLPNITGLSAAANYILTFRLGSYRFTSTGAASGVDLGDYVDLQLSINGGVSYVSELRVTGNNNAYWTYASTAIASKTANSLLTTFTPAGGGDRTSTGDGYSNIKLTLPAGITQCAFYIYCRANSTGEEWWIDNIELLSIAPCSPLPVELTYFIANIVGSDANIIWETATETNSDYFLLERSTDALNWEQIEQKKAAGNSIQFMRYNYSDKNLKNGTYYYRLTQYDFDGKSKSYNIISIDIDEKNKSCDYLYYDLLGKEIDITTVPEGMYIRVCRGKSEKIIKR
jgi:hypothetical protein